jgi:hypothetical protein
MGVTKRELDRVGEDRLVRFLHWVVGKIAPPLRGLIRRMPALRSKLRNTLGGRSGAVFSVIEEKRFAEAFQLTMEGVTTCETNPAALGMQKLYWWIFMERAAECATHLGDRERHEVLARLSRAPEAGGLNEAQCLETFSRWRWRAGDRGGAVEFARGAVLADPSWPAGHIALAWYGLITGEFDPLPRLREAIRLAPDSLATHPRKCRICAISRPHRGSRKTSRQCALTPR